MDVDSVYKTPHIHDRDVILVSIFLSLSFFVSWYLVLYIYIGLFIHYLIGMSFLCFIEPHSLWFSFCLRDRNLTPSPLPIHPSINPSSLYQRFITSFFFFSSKKKKLSISQKKNCKNLQKKPLPYDIRTEHSK